ncbi:MAG: hypothetical protein KGZ58_01200 [Ignavibacteriales bacterium]|nr:hypothetical protein [Ignavibacteriales bacterium]
MKQSKPIITTVDFLKEKEQDPKLEEERLKNEAITILKSYSHIWDILSELFQNSIDAIDQNKKIKVVSKLS